MNRLQELRQKAGLTQKELAQKIEVTPQLVSTYERGTRNPKIDSLQKIADFFGVSIQYLQGTASTFRKYQLWFCSKCHKHFWVTEQPKYCPYCRSTKQLGYGTSKIISF